jgi:ATP-dependent DNA helicase RecQ
MTEFHKILKENWGYEEFRPLQLDIVRSAHSGKDTLALLPTGGGKSITFQVPAMAKEGICIVVTPLIALMKDQVENLQKRKIKTAAIHSGMSMAEISLTLDNCIYGDYKFLYVSPERLETKLFRERLVKMPVNLVAIDEAHCISQWGFDFRPSYLKIAEIRELIPDIPFLALTASAKPKVQQDIIEFLKLENPTVIKKSFFRDNLVYVVRETNDKIGQLVKICNSVKGTGIVYVSTRKRTKEVAQMLAQKRIRADYYHGGLSNNLRADKQDRWQRGSTRVIVATNAFGMGIDKPDVRFVVHLNLPDSLEGYYQEAGRGGRDGLKSYAVLLFNNTDLANINKKSEQMFPEIDVMKRVYQSLCNYLNIPYGGGKGMSFDFNINEFARNFKFDLITAFYSLKYLQTEGYLVMSEEVANPSRVHFVVDRDALYKYQVANTRFDAFIKLLLRSYTGMFSVYTRINEDDLARRAGVTVEVIYNYLNNLDKAGIIHYIPRRTGPQIVLTYERLRPESLLISKVDFDIRRKAEQERVDSVIEYATRKDKCRSEILLAYFGEKESDECKRCDICIDTSDLNQKDIEEQVINELREQVCDADYLARTINVTHKKLMLVLDDMIDRGLIIKNNDGFSLC